MPTTSKNEYLSAHFTERINPRFVYPRLTCVHCGTEGAKNSTIQRRHLAVCQAYINHMGEDNDRAVSQSFNVDTIPVLPSRESTQQPLDIAMATATTLPISQQQMAMTQEVQHSSGSTLSTLQEVPLASANTSLSCPTPNRPGIIPTVMVRWKPPQTIESTTASISAMAKYALAQSHKRRRLVVDDTIQSAAERSTIQDAILSPSISQIPMAKMVDESIQPLQSNGLLAFLGTGVTRYVELVHWASLCANEQEYRNFIFEGAESKPFLPDLDEELAILQQLNGLPNQQVTDILVEYFFLAVQPILSIILSHEFKLQYSKLWQQDGNCKVTLSDPILHRNSTFLCVLWTVLYCGAVVASTETWTTLSITGNKEEIIQKFEYGYQSAMKRCKKQFAGTTEDMLAASLLHYSVRNKGMSAIERLDFAATAMREAQYLGLHQVVKHSGLSPGRFDLRRKIWCHLVSLDLQIAKAYGILPMYRSMQPILQDEMIIELQRINSSSAKTIFTWTSMALAMCRFAAARIENLINQISVNTPAEDDEFTLVREQIYDLHIKIDFIVPNIPTSGLPEEGFSDFNISKAQPLVDVELYRESNGNAPTVFGCWTRMMLTMLKHELDIVYYKAVLTRHCAAHDIATTWHKLGEACVAYIRVHLFKKSTPCYSPYEWFSDEQPLLQAMLCLLKYLEYRKSCHENEPQLSPMTMYIVKEVGNIIHQQCRGCGAYEREGSSGERNRNETHDIAAEWRFLKEVKDRLDAQSGDIDAQEGAVEGETG